MDDSIKKATNHNKYTLEKLLEIYAADSIFSWGGSIFDDPDKLFERDPEEYTKRKQAMIDGSKLAPKKEPWKC